MIEMLQFLAECFIFGLIFFFPPYFFYRLQFTDEIEHKEFEKRNKIKKFLLLYNININEKDLNYISSNCINTDESIKFHSKKYLLKIIDKNPEKFI